MDGLVCRLPSRTVLVGLPVAAWVWLGAWGLMGAVLAVPSWVWPQDSSLLVGGVVGVLGVTGGVGLWVYLFQEMVGEGHRILRADAVGFEVLDAKLARSPMMSALSRHSPGYVFGRWSQIDAVVDRGDALVCTRSVGDPVEVPVGGLTRLERIWLTQRLNELNGRLDASGVVPEALKGLARAGRETS
ncbi:MAG: hypothetical protein H6736_21570 [Alphaproteobacteria bacterium]|nr:hypothetical protein [Alphaproteobacteria bacterium]MCB9694407.1 hypothetical protein [Alphaproteobacteria bacterium]